MRKSDLEAFMGSGLESFVMPDTVKTLGKQVFADCAQLKSVELSESLTEIPERAFQLRCAGRHCIPCIRQ